jgi:hypothetical protein
MVAPFLRKYRPFEEARPYVQTLGLKGQKEWRAFCGGKSPDSGALPEDIPTNPWRGYKDKGWIEEYGIGWVLGGPSRGGCI